MVEDNPNVEVNGIFDLATKQGLQNFLRMQVRSHELVRCVGLISRLSFVSPVFARLVFRAVM